MSKFETTHVVRLLDLTRFELTISLSNNYFSISTTETEFSPIVAKDTKIAFIAGIEPYFWGG